MKTINLTQGRIALVDDDDWLYLVGQNWCVAKQSSSVYAVRGEGPRGQQRTIYMHRVIVRPPEGMEVDHIDGDGLNNVRSNLRIVSSADNSKNRRKLKCGTSRFKGVTYGNGKWRAHIQSDGKALDLGHYGTELDAAKAYDSAALRLHGAFARLNLS